MTFLALILGISIGWLAHSAYRRGRAAALWSEMTRGSQPVPLSGRWGNGTSEVLTVNGVGLVRALRNGGRT